MLRFPRHLFLYKSFYNTSRRETQLRKATFFTFLRSPLTLSHFTRYSSVSSRDNHHDRRSLYPLEGSTGSTPDEIQLQPDTIFSPLLRSFYPLSQPSMKTLFSNSNCSSTISCCLSQQLATIALFSNRHQQPQSSRRPTSVVSYPSSLLINHSSFNTLSPPFSVYPSRLYFPIASKNRYFSSSPERFSSPSPSPLSSTPTNDTSKKVPKLVTQKFPKYIVKSIIRFSREVVQLVAHYTIASLKFTCTTLLDLIRHPSIIFTWWKRLKDGIHHGWHWTVKGFKLFGANFRISLLLVKKKIKGQPLNFREHKLLVRTTADLVKLVPFSFFLVVPFAELLLPVALWLFPGMLPSTFADKQIDHPGLQRKLKAKQELAQFFQETVAERTRQVLEKTTSERSRDRAKMLKEFQEKLISKAAEELQSSFSEGTVESNVPHGESSELMEVDPFLSLKDTLTYAKLFREEFKIENMPTKALIVSLCNHAKRYKGDFTNIVHRMHRYSSPHHILGIQREDREILWEGVDSLSHDELVEACKERAMRFYGVSDEVMRDQMNQWLELSSHKDIPPLLLLWSRSITMTHSQMQKPTEAVKAEEGKAKAEIELKTMLKPVKEVTIAVEQKIEELVASDELLPPVVEELKEQQTVEEIEQEELRRKEEELKARLEEADKRLEELRSEAEALQKETRAEKEESSGIDVEQPTETVLITDRPEEVLKETAMLLNDHEDEHIQSRVDRVRASKEELVRKCEKLEAEMIVLRSVSDSQYEQVAGIVTSLAGLIDEYRQKEKDSTSENRAEYLVDRLEKVLRIFEHGVSDLSEKLESARCIRLGGDDAVFYPDSDNEETKQDENSSNAVELQQNNKK